MPRTPPASSNRFTGFSRCYGFPDDVLVRVVFFSEIYEIQGTMNCYRYVMLILVIPVLMWYNLADCVTAVGDEDAAVLA